MSWVRVVLAVAIVFFAFESRGGARDTGNAPSGADRQAIGPPVVRSGYYDIGAFGGSSLSEDAQIYATRVQGIGALYPVIRPSAAEPELVVRARPLDGATVVAYADFWMADDPWDPESAGTVFAADEAGLIGELERVSQDDYGLVVDRVRGRWARVVYGYTIAGEVRRGWVRLVAGRVAYVSYEEQIRTKPVWFADPAGIGLFDRPGGRRVHFEIPQDRTHAEGGYGLEVLRIAEQWIEVRVTVPDGSPTSAHPETPVDRSVTAWVRRLDVNGRFQIEYAAAGC